MDGTTSNFAPISGDAPSPLALDRTGNYGGSLSLYTGSTGNDRIYQIDAGGNESTFSGFPGSTGSGGPTSIAFDTTANYGGMMYVGTSFGSGDADVSGVFALDTGGSATKFTEDLVTAMCIAFAPAGAFGGDMFVMGQSEFGGLYNLWRVGSDGTATVFASYVSDIAFGLDGAMYVSEFSSTESGMVTISRVTPEPTTILLLGLGSIMLRRKRRA